MIEFALNIFADQILTSSVIKHFPADVLMLNVCSSFCLSAHIVYLQHFFDMQFEYFFVIFFSAHIILVFRRVVLGTFWDGLFHGSLYYIF